MTHAQARHIWLCADDYGISPGVSEAIRSLITQGRLNGTSVMTAPRAFSADEAWRLTEAADGRAAIGLHVTLTGNFAPLANGVSATGRFPEVGSLLGRALLRRLDVGALRAEIGAQLVAFLRAFGRPPDFFDGHQHVHLFPQVRDVVLTLVATEAPRAWIRQCGSIEPLTTRLLRDRKAVLLTGLSATFQRRAAAAGIRTNSAFAGTYDFAPDSDHAALFARFFRGLPDGGLVMCHPGFVDDELRRVDPLTDVREQEYAFLAGDGFARLLAEQNVSLRLPV